MGHKQLRVDYGIQTDSSNGRRLYFEYLAGPHSQRPDPKQYNERVESR
jgi:hypothetical protein